MKSEGTSQRRPKWVHVENGWLVASVAASVAYATISYFSKDPTGRNSIDAVTTGLILSLLFSTVTLLIHATGIARSNSEALSSLEEGSKEIVRISRNVEHGAVRIRRLQTHLADCKGAIRQAGEGTLEDYIGLFRALDHGFGIDGELWALRSYTLFWQQLVEEQAQLEKAKAPGLVARITHSNSIDLWRGKEADILLDLQERFTKKGGKVLRLLLGQFKEPDEKYKEVMARMEKHGIDVLYLSISEEEAKAQQLDYDFLWVAGRDYWVAGRDYVVKWFSGVAGSRLARCELLDTAEPVIRSQWIHFRERIRGERGDNLPEKFSHYLDLP